ncbi:MAG: hypothetical protein WC873_01520 [Candidatus Gracilibacteria bacterium]
MKKAQKPVKLSPQNREVIAQITAIMDVRFAQQDIKMDAMKEEIFDTMRMAFILHTEKFDQKLTVLHADLIDRIDFFRDELIERMDEQKDELIQKMDDQKDEILQEINEYMMLVSKDSLGIHQRLHVLEARK